ncbi:MAG: threonylcarbamoyl-AMP synthase [Bacteroidetes bacterium]|nr:threonylcarbamoyl-AMP synthase [Bacteroidota bacterium]
MSATSIHTDTKPAVFLDRDGTLIEDVGILSSPDQIILFHDTVETLLTLQKHFLLFVITNQGAAASGLISLDQISTVNSALAARLSAEGVEIQEWYVCPHDRSENCDCIKPNSFFVLEAAKNYNLDLQRSYILGDHPHDVLTGEAEGVFGLYLLTGHGLKHIDEVPLDKPVFHTLEDAAEWIFQHPDPRETLQKAIRDGAQALQNGKLVAFPTETVYGLGADALNQDAAAEIFIAKQRPLRDPLIVHVHDPKQVEKLTSSIPEAAIMLMDTFWPGPLTLVLPKSPAVPDIVTAGGPTVAVRMPKHPLALELLRQAGTPVAAPSANIFGKTSPTTAKHVADQLEGRYEVLIDGGACRVGVESTVLTLVGDKPIILRPGGITKEEIEQVIGPVADRSELPEEHMASPGLLPSHYAPATPMVLTDTPLKFCNDEHVAIILRKPAESTYKGSVFVLSPDGDLRSAAAMLYQTLRLVDGMHFDLIVAERFPDKGIGVAANDRMTRAAAKKS